MPLAGVEVMVTVAAPLGAAAKMAKAALSQQALVKAWRRPLGVVRKVTILRITLNVFPIA